MHKTVLLLGATGKIGTHAAEAFWNSGWRIRRFDRTIDRLTEAAMGCDVIVNGFNPPAYQNWAQNIPRITDEVIEAATQSGATIIVPGNVYNYGTTQGEWSEKTVQNPCTRKGQIRKDMEQTYREAANRGVQTIILRGGDFIDPNQDATLMAMVVMKDLKKGKITTLGDPDVVRAYCYLPDWASAAVALAEKRSELSMFEDVPFCNVHFSSRLLLNALEAQLNHPLKLQAFPWWLMRIASPFWGLAYEMLEMRYLFETDHRLSGAKLRTLLPDYRSTDLQTILAAEIPADAFSREIKVQGHSTSTQTNL
ncbi:MAG: NAD-dependent epimerase/dehydratase family protein [Pseudoruegeria sp.]